MSIEEQLGADFKEAMRSKQADRLACIRQVKSKIQEAVNAKGFTGEVDDALYQKIITTYVKSLHKGIDELAAAGDRGVELSDKYRAEIDYLHEFLPKMLDEAQTRALVESAIESMQVTDPKQAGRVMGAVMKDHKGEVDAALVRKLVEEKLAKSEAD